MRALYAYDVGLCFAWFWFWAGEDQGSNEGKSVFQLTCDKLSITVYLLTILLIKNGPYILCFYFIRLLIVANDSCNQIPSRLRTAAKRKVLLQICHWNPNLITKYCIKNNGSLVIVSTKLILCLAVYAVDYILCHNPLKLLYMVGYGPCFPQYIHHRGSSLPSVTKHTNHITCQAQANVVAHVSALTEAYVKHISICLLACQCSESSCKNTWGSYDCSCKGDLLYIRDHDTCISK